MQLTCSLKQFSHAVNLAARAVATRTTIPVLTHLLLATEGESQLRVVGSDLELSVAVTVGCDAVPRTGAVCVPANILGEIAKALPSASSVTLEMDGNYLTVRCGASTFSLHYLPSEEYPDIPQLEQSTLLSPATEDWRMLCKRAGFCAADDGSGKDLLQGMYLRCTGGDGGTLSAISTDSHRLAVMSLPAAWGACEAIIPTRAVNELLRLAEGEETLQVQVGHTGSDTPMLQARCGAVALTTRCIQGVYPDFARAMPVDPPARCVVDRSALLAACKRLRSIALNGRIHLENSLACVTLSASEQGHGGGHEELVADALGEWRTAVNVSYLMQALAVSTSERVSLAQESGLRPIVITDDDARWKSVVMPMADE